MRIHLESLALGAGAAASVFLSLSITGPSGPPRIEYGPHPRDMLVIREGAPYTVPTEKRFVLTGLGELSMSGSTLRVDGVDEVNCFQSAPPHGIGRSMLPVPVGFTVPPGSTIDVVGFHNNGRAWGYLSNYP